MMFKKKKKNASMMITDEEVNVEGEENVNNLLLKIKDKLPFLNKKDKNSNVEEEKKEDIHNKDDVDINYDEDDEKKLDNEKENIKEENHNNDIVDINYDEDDKEEISEDSHNNDIVDINYDEEDKKKENFEDKKEKIKEKESHSKDLVDINYDKKNNKKNSHNINNNTDFNTDFIKNNHPTKSLFKKITGLVTDIIVIIIIGYLVVWSAPKIVNWFSGGRENYVDLAKSMAVQVKDGFNVSRKGCTTTINHRYFYNIYNSKEQFGDKYVSPIDGQPMEGYIEFESYDSGFTTYITLSDGFFGINHIKLEDLSKSDIKIFTFLGLDNYKDMDCNKPIEITKK